MYEKKSLFLIFVIHYKYEIKTSFMSKYDVAVIGSGPGGYVAAIRCAQLGMKTAIIEKYNTLGGTCLNVGCIPSKALLDSSHHYDDAMRHFEEHGIDIPGDIKINFEKMIARKQKVVDQTCDGVAFLMKKNNIDVFTGMGSFVDATHIKIEGEETQTIEAAKTIIATGSKPATLPFIELDKESLIFILFAFITNSLLWIVLKLFSYPSCSPMRWKLSSFIMEVYALVATRNPCHISD